MLSCAYYLYWDGWWSYAGHVALEVLGLSTFLAIFMLIDSCVNCPCMNRARMSDASKSKLVTGVADDSDDDYADLPNNKKKKKVDEDEYGEEDDQNES